MPYVNGSGNIFNADGQAGFATGVIRGKIGGGARLDYTCPDYFSYPQVISVTGVDSTMVWVYSGLSNASL